MNKSLRNSILGLGLVSLVSTSCYLPGTVPSEIKKDQKRRQGLINQIYDDYSRGKLEVALYNLVQAKTCLIRNDPTSARNFANLTLNLLGDYFEVPKNVEDTLAQNMYEEARQIYNQSKKL